MCGIAAAIDWDGAEQAVKSLLRGVAHRGDVDDPVLSPSPTLALGTRRLRVVDRDRAVQPQMSSDGRLAVVFNGEIYNHAALRRELEGLGVKFRTESDTEVLANALQVWGAKALARLNGMFAFVAVDLASGEFLAARDPFGVKPLYIVQSARGFLFCSEIRPLLNAAGQGDVLLLPPGYLLTRKVCAGYVTAVGGPFAGQSPGDPAMLDRLLADAVRLRIPDGLPVATKLSGGIDSTLIAHYARRFRPDAPSYFLGGEGAEDFRYAAAYAEKSKIDLRVVPVAPSPGDIEAAVTISESFEPTVVRGAVCSLALSAAMHRDGFRVVLCGDGADELFAGYVPLELAFAQGDAVGRAVRAEIIEQMHRTCLQRVDRCAMDYQIETRQPFLDPCVAAYALDLRGDALVRGFGKMPLRELYNLYPDELPASIRDRRKVPFDEGAGLEPDAAIWNEDFDRFISDAEFEDGQREFAAYTIRTREELHYLRVLSRSMDISRVPHLRGRVHLTLPFAVPDARRKVA